MVFRRLSLFIAIILTAVSAFADAAFNIVPPRNVVEGRNFMLTFRLTDGEANPPKAPQLAGCTLLYGPSTSTMQSTQIINGKMSSSFSIDYSYTYRADKAGTVEVPSLSVSVEGRTLSSRAASFKILPAEGGSQSQGRQQGGAQIDDVSTQQPGQVAADDLLVRISFSKSSLYEQEPVVATIKVYTKYGITSFQATTQPTFEGFLMEELPVSQEGTIEHYNGKNYHVFELKRLLLYPQRSGKLSVNSGKYDVTIEQYETVNMGFFRTQRPVERRITTSSNAASIQVNPLPEPKPAGFNGAVGVFSASTSLQPEILRTNEAAVYSYIIKGTGNIKFLSDPVVTFPHGVDTYTPKNDIKANVAGANMSGSYTTQFTFVPQEVGNFEITPAPFVFFNSNTHKYETIELAPTPIKVLRGNGPAANVEQSDIDKTIDDILHIKPIKAGNQTHEIDYTFNNPVYWLAYILVIGVLVATVVLYRRKIRLDSDVTGRRLAKASRVATKRLREARGFMDRHENDKFYASLASALWGYISDKLSMPSSQLTRDNVASKLEEFGLSQDATDRVLRVLDDCEMARFTPSHSDEEVADLYRNASEAINSIENVKR